MSKKLNKSEAKFYKNAKATIDQNAKENIKQFWIVQTLFIFQSVKNSNDNINF